MRARRGGARLAQASAARRGLRRALGASGVVDTDPLDRRADGRGQARRIPDPSDRRPPRDVAVSYLRGRRAAFGLDSTDIAALELTRRYASESGVVHLWWEQTYRGIPSFDQGLRANVDADGRLINIGGAPRPDLAVDSIVPGVGPREALEAAARSVSASVRPGTRRSQRRARPGHCLRSWPSREPRALRRRAGRPPCVAGAALHRRRRRLRRRGGRQEREAAAIAPASFTTWPRSRSTITRARQWVARRWARTFLRPG